MADRTVEAESATRSLRAAIELLLAEKNITSEPGPHGAKFMGDDGNVYEYTAMNLGAVGEESLGLLEKSVLEGFRAIPDNTKVVWRCYAEVAWHDEIKEGSAIARDLGLDGRPAMWAAYARFTVLPKAVSAIPERNAA